MTSSSSSLEQVRDVAPEPAAVHLDPRTTALVVMDIIDPLCTKRPRCVASIPRIAALLADARRSGAHIVHTVGPRQPATILDGVAPREGEPVVSGRADKFFDTELNDVLRSAGVETLLLVGTSANGAVLYTSFAANLRGYTVAVAVDAISADDPATEVIVAWQLLNQPGYANPANDPLTPERVTLTRTDLVSFQA